MGEESHLDEMRSAIRGDFERLARRRGGQELLRVEPAGTESEPTPEPSAESSDALEAAGSAAEQVEEPLTRSWVARLLGR